MVMAGQGLSREALYELVWEKPVSKLVAELGLSYWELKLRCKKLAVPLPPQGHWSRLQYGKPVEKLPLPPAPAGLTGGSVFEAGLGKDDGAVDAAIGSVDVLPDLSASRFVVEPPKLYPGESELSFAVPDQLIRPDKLIVAAEKALQNAVPRMDDYETVRTGVSNLTIRVTPRNIGRALRIMDTLVKCMQRRGWRIECKDYQTFVHIRDCTKRISLRELAKKLPKKGPHDHQRYEAVDKLVFKMDYWMGREWRDGRLLLEEQIRDILDHMESAAADIERQRAYHERKKVEVDLRGSTMEDDAVDASDAVVAPGMDADASKAMEDVKELSDAAFEEVLAEAQRWKQLQVLDEYLGYLALYGEDTPAFKAWFQAVKKKRAAQV